MDDLLGRTSTRATEWWAAWNSMRADRRQRGTRPDESAAVDVLIEADSNPIEMMWSKVKALLRSAEGLQRAIAAALPRTSAQDAARWFAACGYSII